VGEADEGARCAGELDTVPGVHEVVAVVGSEYRVNLGRVEEGIQPLSTLGLA
jgi:hypothetical protein